MLLVVDMLLSEIYMIILDVGLEKRFEIYINAPCPPKWKDILTFTF